MPGVWQGQGEVHPEKTGIQAITVPSESGLGGHLRIIKSHREGDGLRTLPLAVT
jgi:hypothetical protein